MIERKEDGQAPDTEMDKPGTYLKSEETDADNDVSDVKDESDGMKAGDFLGKSNLENRDEESPENA